MDALTRDLCRLADGERDAFDDVWNAAQPRVSALCVRMLGHTADADDAAQQAMVNVFRRAPEFRPTVGRALPWILGIAAWECRTVRRRSARRREGELPADLTASQDVEAGLVHADLRLALQQVLVTLTPADQATLNAVLERCERPNVAPATFRKRVERALTRLRTAWSTTHG